MDSKFQVRKIRKIPVQRVQIDLYKNSSGKFSKQHAVSKNAFASKSTAISPSVTGNNTPHTFRFKQTQQIRVQNPQHVINQVDKAQTGRQGAKSVAKFHSRQSSVVRQSINTAKNRSISPAVINVGNKKLTQKTNNQKFLSLQKNSSATEQLNNQNQLIIRAESKGKIRQQSVGKISPRDSLRLPSIQNIQEESEIQKIGQIPTTSNQKSSNKSTQPNSNLSTKQSMQTSPEHTFDLLKLLDTKNEEKQQIIAYLQSYYEKHRLLPITTPQLYNFIKLIGKGGFAKVALATHKLTGMNVAIKTINKKRIRDENHKRRIMQEAHMLKRIKHANVIKCFEMFETQKYIMIVMEYCPGGSLSKFLKQIDRFSESQVKHIFRQIVKATHCIHFNRILHRDIKPGNLLFFQDLNGELNKFYPVIKICDFGTSAFITYGERIHRQCGTPSYIAPEIAQDQGYEGFNSDI